MSMIRRISALLGIGAGTFLVTYVGSQRLRDRPAGPPAAALLTDVSDSTRLTRLGMTPGLQLVAYVFGSSQCGYCKRPEMKLALGKVRSLLRQNLPADFRSVRVVGTSVNTDIPLGLSYLTSIGLDRFDEISVGNGWLNRHVIDLMWNGGYSRATTPTVILAAHRVNSEYFPDSVRVGPDSILGIVSGYNGILAWVEAGARLKDARPYRFGDRVDSAASPRR